MKEKVHVKILQAFLNVLIVEKFNKSIPSWTRSSVVRARGS